MRKRGSGWLRRYVRRLRRRGFPGPSWLARSRAIQQFKT